ncbi:helix-turn-helix domain-containing protein [Burkholderia cenocepacia]|uniref:helix-turn-helix domain-containing protein n=1 Tax=Burkholderia cenocepacia TaxID=95486 RepID=UPI00396B428F
MSVLYVYRCQACGHRGEVNRPDDTYEGAAALCAECHEAVALEWDGGVTLAAGGTGGGEDPPPTPEGFKAMREKGKRTQATAAALLGVLPRQVQRWEAGEAEIPISAWKLLRRTWGYRYPTDFERVEDFERGWDKLRDRPRTTIERGDVVELQPVDGGPLLRATVWLDRVHDGLLDEDSYGAYVTEFVGAAGVGAEYRGFVIGEHVTFARSNVIHLEQRPPRR